MPARSRSIEPVDERELTVDERGVVDLALISAISSWNLGNRE